MASVDTSNPVLRAAFGPPANAAAANLVGFQWPWDIASRGGQYFGDHSGAASSLVQAAQAVTGSPQGSGIVQGISNGPTNPQNTNQMLDDGLFSQALDSVRADQLLRTVFIGWAGGAQVGIFGGGGGGGVTYDIIDHSNLATVTYGMFNIGIGGQVVTGLLVGAMSREPHDLNSSTCVFQFGASLGVAAFVSVIMDSDNLDLIGFTLDVGVGAGFSSATGYGSISAS